MPDISGTIDCSAWTGNWPFHRLRYRELPELEEKLREVGISRAFVAPIEGLLEQDPHRANICLLEEAQKHDLIVSLQMRVEDKRSRHPLLGVADLNIMDVAKALGQFPEQVFIVHNIYRREIEAVLKWLSNVYLDIAGVETADTLEWLKANFGLDRFVFAGHAPFYFPEGNCCKLTCSQLGQGEVEKVAFGNAAGVFGF